MDSPPPSSSEGAAPPPPPPPPVDPFLVEALENPRHRLTVLRMELEIKKFLMNTDQHQFEFQHFTSSYLRRAAHRVAQYYGLQTLVFDGPDKARIIAIKSIGNPNPPPIPLSQIPAKEPENPKPIDSLKIVIRARPARQLAGGGEAAIAMLRNDSLSKSVEEREEEYGKARARIFNEEREGSGEEGERMGARVAAIFRDREKDRSDPDYDRSYQRYVRGALTSQRFGIGGYGGQNGQRELGFNQMGHMQGGYQGSGSYVSPCPCPTMMYAQAYDYFRDNVFQGPPFCQQPLSFEQHHHR